MPKVRAQRPPPGTRTLLLGVMARLSVIGITVTNCPKLRVAREGSAGAVENIYIKARIIWAKRFAFQSATVISFLAMRDQASFLEVGLRPLVCVAW